MGATLRQLGFHFQLVYGNLNWSLAEKQLLKGVYASFAQTYLSKAKLGLVGYHAPGFQDLHPDPFALRKTFGTLMLHLDLAEYQQVQIDSAEIEKDVEKVKANKWPLTGQASYDDLPTSSKHYLVMKKLIEDHNLDGIAVRCWPELPNSPGFESWCYLALARLATEGKKQIDLRVFTFVTQMLSMRDT